MKPEEFIQRLLVAFPDENIPDAEDRPRDKRETGSCQRWIGGRNWRSVATKEVAASFDCISYFTDEQQVYYLPCWLKAGVLEVDSMAGPGAAYHVGLNLRFYCEQLSPSQLALVSEFMHWLASEDEDEWLESMAKELDRCC